MPHFVAFDGHVAGVVFVDRRDNGDLIDDFQIESAVDEGVGFFGVVREQPNAGEAQVLKQLNPDAVIAGVGFVAEGDVCFDRIEAFVLQLVGFDLFNDANAPAFLRQVNQDPAAFAANHVEGHVQLVAAIAA